MAILTREGQLKQNIDNAVQLAWTNATGASQNVGNIIAIDGDSGKRIAAMVLNESTGLSAVANGGKGQILIYGRIKIKKSTSTAFTQGQSVYWDASANQADSVATASTVNDFVVGMCTASVAAAVSFVEVDLNQGPSAFAPASSSSSSSSSSTAAE